MTMIKVWLSSPVTRIKLSANSTYIHFSSSHIMFTLCVYDLTFIYEGRGHGGGVTEEKAAEPVISDGCWVSTFVSVKNLDHFRETLGQFPAVFMVTNTGIMKPKPNQVFFICLNITRP